MKKLIAGINLFVGVNEVILKGSSMYLLVLNALCFLLETRKRRGRCQAMISKVSVRAK